MSEIVCRACGARMAFTGVSITRCISCGLAPGGDPAGQAFLDQSKAEAVARLEGSKAYLLLAVRPDGACPRSIMYPHPEQLNALIGMTRVALMDLTVEGSFRPRPQS